MTDQPITPAPNTGEAEESSPLARTIRRLYVYVVAGATLVLVAIGAIQLLELLLGSALAGLTGEPWLQGEPGWERERLSFSLAFLLIATPIWFLHWRMAGRAVRGPDAVAERQSVIRAVYVALLMLASLFLVPGLVTVLELAFNGALGQSISVIDRESLITSLAVTLVVGLLWAYHLRAYVLDLRLETDEPRSALLPQIALYLVCAVSAFILLFGAVELIQLATDLVLAPEPGARDWRSSLASGVALAMTGGALWLFHWRFTEHLLHTSSWWGRSAAGSTVRRVYLVTVSFVAGLVVLTSVAESADSIARQLLDTRDRPGSARLNASIDPLLTSIPFLIFWIAHVRRLMAEPRGPGSPIQDVTARRIATYAMAFLGLLLVSIGAAMLLAELIRTIAGERGWWPDAGWSIGAIAGGGALWVWQWRQIRRRLQHDPASEQLSALRRAYLFVVLGGSLVALVVGLAMTVYQVLQVLLGVTTGAELAIDVSLPLGITLTATGSAIYHGLLLRRDLAVHAAGTPTDLATSTRLDLVLTGPLGGHPADVLDTLRPHLPDGYDLTIRQP